MPEDEAGVRAALLGLVERAIGRLTERAAVHAERAAAEAGERAVRLGFEVGAEGEQLRRYQFGCERSLKRSLDTLIKLRRGGGGQGREPGGDEPQRPAPPAAKNEATTPRDTEILPVSGPGDGPETPVAPAPDSQPQLQNEATAPMAPVAAQPSDQNEAIPPAVDHSRTQNEATAPAGGTGRPVPIVPVTAVALLALAFSACIAAASERRWTSSARISSPPGHRATDKARMSATSRRPVDRPVSFPRATIRAPRQERPHRSPRLMGGLLCLTPGSIVVELSLAASRSR